MRIKAVAFDVDGTLYPNSIMYRRSIPFALAHPRLLSSYGRVRRRIRQVRPVSDFRSLQAELLSAELRVSRQRAAELVETLIYRKWELVLKRTPLFPGLREALAAFRAHKLKLAVLSDFPVERKLSYLGLEGIWDCELSAEESGYLKPNPEPFLMLCRCLDCEPANVLYVGNSYSYDVIGAYEIGMPTAHLCPKPEPNSVADLTFDDYRTLREWVGLHLDSA